MELPHLSELQKKYAKQGLKVIAVDVMNMTERASNFIQAKQLNMVMLENGDDNPLSVNNLLLVKNFPFTVVADSEGRAMYIHRGFLPGSPPYRAG